MGIHSKYSKKVSVNSPIIFCAAYNQYALEAFENSGKYWFITNKNQVVQLYTLEGSQFPIFQSLEELENKLVPEFFRINRQFIVNRKVIKDVSRHFGRKLLINLTIPFSEPLIVGKERTTHFMKWLSEN